MTSRSEIGSVRVQSWENGIRKRKFHSGCKLTEWEGLTVITSFNQKILPVLTRAYKVKNIRGFFLWILKTFT
jgi:hypothetical protein